MKIILFILLILFCCKTQAIICYPHKVDFSPLEILQPKSINNWIHEPTNDPTHITTFIPDFYSDGSKVKIECFQEANQYRRIVISENIYFYCNFTIIKPFFPVYYYDYDNNGLMDIKLEFFTGGNSGNANNARVLYFLQYEKEWHLISFYIRDSSYTWECDIDKDGKYELLKGHHQDKEKPGYHDVIKDKWVSSIYRKYLFINAYSIEYNGLKLCNDLSPEFPKIFCFEITDPFNITNNTEFIKYNQFKLPDYYQFQHERI